MEPSKPKALPSKIIPTIPIPRASRWEPKTTATELLKSLPSFSAGRWVITVLPRPKVQRVERIVAIDTSQIKFP
ncbi:hypothetical protein M1N50_01660 [Dehalococcoidia bacterium]|nr:hypothetical protein [Dehalococcoidia bacterium]